MSDCEQRTRWEDLADASLTDDTGYRLALHHWLGSSALPEYSPDIWLWVSDHDGESVYLMLSPDQARELARALADAATRIENGWR